MKISSRISAKEIFTRGKMFWFLRNARKLALCPAAKDGFIKNLIYTVQCFTNALVRFFLNQSLAGQIKKIGAERNQNNLSLVKVSLSSFDKCAKSTWWSVDLFSHTFPNRQRDCSKTICGSKIKRKEFRSFLTFPACF